ncbi:hypothetical protein CRUP_011989, partial [Coryphaenoides rupestris]
MVSDKADGGGMRILVTLLLDTLPMLGNVLLLCFFVFFIFGIVGVQLWAGLLRNRCFVKDNFSFPMPLELGKYYHTENDDENPFICSQPRENGMRECGSVPVLYEEGGVQCKLDMDAYNSTDNTTCVNWNQYYTNCSAGLVNPFKGAINFDNICYAWIAIFQIGSFFMINLCLVVIATQFSETKQRESQLMKEQRVRFLSNASTLASFSEPGSCYDELLKYLVHVGRHRRRRKASRQGSVSVHQLSHHHHNHQQHQQHLLHHHHLHHHHCHLGNGSVRRTAGGRGLHAGAGPAVWDLEAGSRGNLGGGRLSLAPPCVVATANSDTNLTALGGDASSSTRSLCHAAERNLDSLRLSPSPASLGPPSGPYSLSRVPAPGSRAMKRNSVPFAGPGPKNHPALPATALAESRRGSAAANIHCGLNIPAVNPERRPSSLVDTRTPTGQLSRQLSARDLSTGSSSPGADGPTSTFDPEGCPYCAKALSESEGGGGGEGIDTPGDSDSEGVYEFTQDLQHRDRRDSRQPPRGQRGLSHTAGKVVRLWRLVCDTFRKIVDSKYFGRGIMIAILINTLSMGIEYHEQ